MHPSLFPSLPLSLSLCLSVSLPPSFSPSLPPRLRLSVSVLLSLSCICSPISSLLYLPVHYPHYSLYRLRWQSVPMPLPKFHMSISVGQRSRSVQTLHCRLADILWPDPEHSCAEHEDSFRFWGLNICNGDLWRQVHVQRRY